MRHKYVAGGALLLFLVAGGFYLSAQLSRTAPAISTKNESEMATEKLEELLNEKFAVLLDSLAGHQAKEFSDADGSLKWIVAKENGSRSLRITVRALARTRDPSATAFAISGIKHDTH